MLLGIYEVVVSLQRNLFNKNIIGYEKIYTTRFCTICAI